MTVGNGDRVRGGEGGGGWVVVKDGDGIGGEGGGSWWGL